MPIRKFLTVWTAFPWYGPFFSCRILRGDSVRNSAGKSGPYREKTSKFRKIWFILFLWKNCFQKYFCRIQHNILRSQKNFHVSIPKIAFYRIFTNKNGPYREKLPYSLWLSRMFFHDIWTIFWYSVKIWKTVMFFRKLAVYTYYISYKYLKIC